MKLLQLQRKMARAVMLPLTPAETMRSKSPDGRSMRAVAAQFIKPNDRLTSFERLEIYNRQYWFRILSALAEDFPGVRAVLGERRFDAMAKAYLADCPSTSFTLRNLGSRLPSWLRAHPKYLGPRKDLALDMARLEWAHVEAFDGKAEPVLRPEEIKGGAPAGLRLHLQPYLQLLDLHYAVDDLVIAISENEEGLSIVSNAMTERRHHAREKKAVRLRRQPIFLAVHRSQEDNTVYYRRLERAEFFLLTALRDGKSLGAASAVAVRKGPLHPKHCAKAIQAWFHNWAALGWFCTPDKHRG
jgi:hypothetical protein